MLMQAGMPALHMRLLVTDYTLDPAQARQATLVDPTGLNAFARQSPDPKTQRPCHPGKRLLSLHTAVCCHQQIWISAFIPHLGSYTCAQFVALGTAMLRLSLLVPVQFAA